MGIRAYSESYLSEAQDHLAIYFDLAVNWLGDIDLAAKMFLESGMAARFENGDPSVISGMSGAELAARTFFLCRKTGLFYDEVRNELSKEYWLGYVLAYYQWWSGRSFECILKAVPASKMLLLYSPYHEMDIHSFCQRIDDCFPKRGQSLQKARTKRGLSQKDLSLLSGIPLRSIQQYEQGSKSLAKASFETVLRLAKALGEEPLAIL